MRLRSLVMALVLAGVTGCGGKENVQQKSPTGPQVIILEAKTPVAVLKERVGSRVTLRARWNALGKLGPQLVTVDEPRSAEVNVYVTSQGDTGALNRLNQAVADGAVVEVTGTLRHYEAAPYVAPADPRMAVASRPMSHYFMQADDVEVRVLEGKR